MNYLDPAVQSAVIQALVALVLGLAGIFAGKEFAARKRLQQKLVDAQKDIEFLLVVEEIHCELHQDHVGESFKIRVRDSARVSGFKWSGQFTPGRANDSRTLKKAKLACAA